MILFPRGPLRHFLGWGSQYLGTLADDVSCGDTPQGSSPIPRDKHTTLNHVKD